MNTFFNKTRRFVMRNLVTFLTVLGLLPFSYAPAYAQDAAPTPPFETVIAKNEKGDEVTTLEGFDLQEWGGTTDPKCTRTELDAVELKEEVGSADEACVLILEWSLKNADDTIVSGFYSFLPREWIRLGYELTHDRVRFVGTMWYVPQSWNAHMLAADLAGDWQRKNPGLVTYVGLSPTDPWVQGLWSDAEAADGAPAPVESDAPSGGYTTTTAGCLMPDGQTIPNETTIKWDADGREQICRGGQLVDPSAGYTVAEPKASGPSFWSRLWAWPYWPWIYWPIVGLVVLGLVIWAIASFIRSNNERADEATRRAAAQRIRPATTDDDAED